MTNKEQEQQRLQREFNNLLGRYNNLVGHRTKLPYQQVVQLAQLFLEGACFKVFDNEGRGGRVLWVTFDDKLGNIPAPPPFLPNFHTLSGPILRWHDVARVETTKHSWGK